jgi:hypothetical protein
MLASMPDQIPLGVAIDIEPPDHAPAADRLLPDTRVYRLSAPCNIARKADIH